MTTSNGTFAEKVAFITGGSSGIGRATALAFAREGAKVVVASWSEEDNQDTVRLVEEAGGKALAVTCDVSRSKDVQQALQQTIQTYGQLDFAFNNAGIEQPIAALNDITEEEWMHLIDINLGGVFLCMKYQIPLLLKQGGGVVVNTSKDKRHTPPQSTASSDCQNQLRSTMQQTAFASTSSLPASSIPR